MRVTMRVLFCIICTQLLQVDLTAQSSQKFQKQVLITKRVIERNHYSPKPVNDDFSMQLFNSLLERMDERKLFFTSTDIKELSFYSLKLDEELGGREWMFFEKLRKLYKERLFKADSTIRSILENPFDLTLDESISLTKDSFRYASNSEEFKKQWQKWLKYQVLDQLAKTTVARKADKKTVLQSEPVARNKVKTAELRNIKKILDPPGGYDEYIASVVCDALANLFDPHTEYMPLFEKQKFEAHLGTEGFYFGLSVKENDKGEIEISRLMPGSPAWKCGELNIGDVLLKLAWEGRDSIDLRGVSQQELSELLNGPANSRMLLTVRKANGLEKTTPLVKEKIRNDDNTVKGFVLKGENRIGYIYLPDFYTDLEGNLNSSSANDVAKEIVKLKKENIEGLILDVRYNGGGSLREALDMAGIFIDEGPLCMIKEKTGKTTSLKDMNRGTIYDGPLALLVNGQSASASELLGAVMQDYNRAIVVGGNTFGKGTAQVILPVDTNASANAGNHEYGFVKVTTGKFFRVNGNTTQHRGVKPDILLPDIFDGLDYRESFSATALSADTVKRNSFYKPLSSLPVRDLVNKSKERTTGHKGFVEIEKYIIWLRNSQKESAIPVSLKWDIYLANAENEEVRRKNILPFNQVNSSVYKAENNSFDLDKLKTDPFLTAVNDTWIKKIVQDIYIEETFLILVDHLKLIKSNP